MDPLQLSTFVIDSGNITEPLNRITNELTELADGLAIVESFSHTYALKTEDGLCCFDASGAGSGNAVVAALRNWSQDPFSTLIYTHGHADHIGGSFAFAKDSQGRGDRPLSVFAHENVEARMDRYAATNGWNVAINQRQFGGVRSEMSLEVGDEITRFLPRATLRPNETFATSQVKNFGDTEVEFHHARGETDDHLWAVIPEKGWLFSGDFIIWNYPNAGNPQKVQRYALEWAQALRAMAAAKPELLLPAHGLPIEGQQRIAMVLDDMATTLETLVSDVVAQMNDGATLDEILHSVHVAPEVLAKPYLRPLYDEPEFVVRNIWRLYGGWYDGAPSRLKPAPDAVLGAEIAALAGGAMVLAERAVALCESDLRLACHLVDLAAWAEPTHGGVHEARAAVYRKRRGAELSLMAKGIFTSAARESEAVFKAEH